MKKFLQSLHSSLPQWMADWLDVLVPAVEVALIIICAMTLMRVIKMYINRLVSAYALPVKSALLIQRMIGFIVYGGAILWSLERIGVSGAVLWSAFTGFAAVGAVAFFAAWSVLSNLFCALLIYTTQAFRVGDVIEVIDGGDKPGVKGRVLDINLVYTTLVEENANGSTNLQLPNSMFFQRIVRKWNDNSDALL
jgi:small-conductance mechanosensitive channel